MCILKDAAAVSDLLTAEWYSKQWPLIFKAEFEASAVNCFFIKLNLANTQLEMF